MFNFFKIVIANASITTHLPSSRHPPLLDGTADELLSGLFLHQLFGRWTPCFGLIRAVSPWLRLILANKQNRSDSAQALVEGFQVIEDITRLKYVSTELLVNRLQ
jgi:hypothetical protein